MRYIVGSINGCGLWLGGVILLVGGAPPRPAIAISLTGVTVMAVSHLIANLRSA